MGIFDKHLEKAVQIQAEIIQDLERKNSQLTRELIHCIKHCKHPIPPRPVKLIVTFNNNLNSSQMSLELKSGQSSTGTLSLVYTDVTPNVPVTGPVTFTNLTAASDNDAIATVTANADSTVTANGISAGVANATINAIAAFSDASGARSEAVSGVEVITVDATPPPPRPVGLVVTWSTPA